MWVAQGLALGIGLFAAGSLLYLGLTTFKGTENDKRLDGIRARATANPYFWAAFFATLALGIVIMGVWPGQS